MHTRIRRCHAVGLRTVLLALLSLATALVAQAQGVTNVIFTPPAPHAGQQITAQVHFTQPLCGFEPTTVVVGTTIRTTIVMTGCFLGPGNFPDVIVTTFGPLPAGTYNYEVYFQYENTEPGFDSSRPLVVAPAGATVPTLRGLGLSLLAASVLLVGLLALRHH